MNILLISELINKDGSPITGGKKLNQVDNKTTSKSTTDDFVGTSRQGISYYNNHGRVYVGEEEEIDPSNPKEVKKKPKKSPKKRKKKGVNENVFTKKDFDREFVQNRDIGFNLNEIQPIESIKETNPVLLRKVNTLKDIIEKTSTSGEEKAVILNFLLDMDLSDVPSQHKKILMDKLR